MIAMVMIIMMMAMMASKTISPQHLSQWLSPLLIQSLSKQVLRLPGPAFLGYATWGIKGGNGSKGSSKEQYFPIAIFVNAFGWVVEALLTSHLVHPVEPTEHGVQAPTRPCQVLSKTTYGSLNIPQGYENSQGCRVDRRPRPRKDDPPKSARKWLHFGNRTISFRETQGNGQ